jgi:hypothetical protein
MKWLTKSNFSAFLVHPAKLWLTKFDPDKLPPWDDAAEARAVEGRQIEELARKRWPDGLKVEGELFDRPAITKAAALQGVDVLFEAAVLTDRKLYAAADVLVKRPNDTWDLYEIKSSTRVKDEQIADVAFQVAAFHEAGWKVGRQFVMHINGDYVRHGELDPMQLIKVEEVTADVMHRSDRVLQQIIDALNVLTGPCPPLDVTKAGNFHDWMKVMRFMHPTLPPESIFNLCRLDADLVTLFKNSHVTKLSDIPLDMPSLKPQQVTQLKAFHAGKPVINARAIASRLSKLEYPLYFLDYETTAPAVPLYDGIKPYQQLPFQYSLHIQFSPTAKLMQCEFLAEGPGNPAPALVKQLMTDLGPTGSVIVWYKPFEMSRNTELGNLIPGSAEYFKQVNTRVFDLMEIFSEGLYADAKCLGSASIKAVLPVLVPDMTYKTLGIQEGNAASRRWGQASRGELEDDDARKVYDDLLIYCRQDTMAMVRIYQVLLAIGTKLIAE